MLKLSNLIFDSKHPYYIVEFRLPLALPLPDGKYQINTINLKSYVGTITSVTLAAGITFELPVLIYFLSKAGLVTPEFLRKYRRHAIIVILILAATITPPDIFRKSRLFMYHIPP